MMEEYQKREKEYQIHIARRMLQPDVQGLKVGVL